MGHIFLGHGSLTPGGYSYQDGMDTVAVPPGTTLQFYSDAGQGLVVTINTLINWSALDRPWPPLTSANVTYNLGLGGFSDELDGINKWLGILGSEGIEHTIHIPGLTGDVGADELLCTGAVGDCPTDPRTQQNHTCDGILGRFGGQDLYWIACTSLVLPKTETLTDEDPVTKEEVDGMRAVMNAALGNGPKDAVLGANPDDLLAATLQLLDNYDTALDFHAYFYVMITPEQRAQLQHDPRVAEWLSANPV